MTRTVWINGKFVAEHEAQVSIFDRGLLFADAVYEGLGVLDGRIIDLDHHMARLRRSMGELGFETSVDDTELTEMLDRLIRLNQLREGFVYLQITRGVHDRDYLYPGGLRSNIFAFTQDQHGGTADGPPQSLTMATTPDLRWARRDIKTTNLLGQVLAKVAAQQAGADEALMLDGDGKVTEGGAMSFFIVKDKTLFARALKRDLLPGITRKTMLGVADAAGITVSERKFTVEDVYSADEALATGASSYIQPVIQVDERKIADGKPGPLTLRIREAYLVAVRASFPGKSGRNGTSSENI